VHKGCGFRLDLPTHVVFGVAIGFVFFSRLDIALLIGIGALLPDLDREYWFIRFIKLQKNREEQLHRALFHNVFIIAFIYFFVPFISLGILLHMLLDSFTTYKDRGCEWFYPVSRFVKRGLKDGQGNDQPLDSIEHIYFYQEDPNGVDNIELDLKETGPVPWRRIYGPALNSHLLDRGFLFGSIAIILIWLFVPDSTHLNMILNQQSTPILLFGYFSLAVLFIAGEFDRGDKPLRLKGINFVKYPIFVVGIALLIYWLYLIRSQLLANFEIILANGASIVLGCIIVIVISFAVIKWQTRSGKNAII
jgi:hypothetical protein